MIPTAILGSGIYLPSQKVSNEELEKLLGLKPGYIEETTGIKERRWAAQARNTDYETEGFMALSASHWALKEAGLKKVDAFFVCRDIIANQRAHSYMPEIKSILERDGIDTSGAVSVDIANNCASFAPACNLANLMIQAGQIENAVVVASSKFDDIIVKRPEFYGDPRNFNPNSLMVRNFSVDPSNPGFQSPALNSFLWGSGAGAVVIGKAPQRNILGYSAKSNTKYLEDNFAFGQTSLGETFCVLDGASIYKYAMTEIPAFLRETERKLGLDLKKMKLVPHQPSPRMLDRLAERASLSKENVMQTCEYLGNMASASIPITYHLSRQEGKIAPGDDVAFLSFGDSYLTSSLFAFKEAGK